MSREVRRVPLDWKHPTEPNPYWLEQAMTRRRMQRPESRLHTPEVRFIGLMDDYPGRLADWEQELADVRARTGHRWAFTVEYHLTGFKGRNDARLTVHPYWVWSEDGEAETKVDVRDEDHLHELEVAKVESERPDPANYMPTFEAPESALGWCLYETVSEGTPTTPVFARAEELIDHLATVGQDYDQQPMRRAAAEVLVRSGSSLGSMLVIGGEVLSSSDDADLIAAKLGGPS